MLQKAVEQRAMGFSAASLNDPGTVTQGIMSQQDVYTYLLMNLTDAPTISSVSKTWDGMTTGASVTSYESYPNATPRRVIVTLPNGTKSTQCSYNHPPVGGQAQYDDGLVYLDETRDAAGTLLQSSQTVWEKGAFDSPRPVSVAATDERGQTTGTEFSYGASYNRVIETRNYDYGYVYQGGGNALLRRTVTEYETAQGYINRHIYNLVHAVNIYGGDGARASRTEYQYDGATAPTAPNGGASLVNLPTVVAQHDDAYNPYAPQTWVPENCYCLYDEFGNCIWTCDPGYWQTAYDPSTDYRGNVTQITRYTNAATEPATGAITETRQYDITGNMVVAATSCCQQASFTYTQDTQYAYPQSQKKGSPTDTTAQLTSSATYDFNTGLALSSTDANGRTSYTSYYADTLRPQTQTLSSGAHTDYVYDEAGMSVTQTTYLAPPPADTGAVADQNVKLLNGLGLVRQERALGASGVWDFVDTEYDVMGQVSRQTRPYRGGETQQWNTTEYDALGRVIKGQAPDGTTPQTGSATRTFYNEAARPSAATPNVPGETVRAVDAWGRERWARFDAVGRLVEVVEPDAGGDGTVANNGLRTNYTYDVLGNLTGVVQGSQTRSFKYDSLGRLIRQKLAEQTATLDDAGNYVGAGGAGALWGEAFTYDDRSNLVGRTDARGVRTIFNYNNDPLNRLQSVSYDLSGPHESLPASPINASGTASYGYVQSGEVTRLSSVSAGVGGESYAYNDPEGRLSGVTVTINGRAPYYLDYAYDTLDRVKSVRYPNEYGLGAAPRKLVEQTYDVASRMSGLQVDSVAYASELSYNAASQTTMLKVGPANSYQTTENYGYDPRTGLLQHQDVWHATQGTLLSLDYSYLRDGTSDGRTGQLTKISDNRDHNRDRSFEYDALGRLKRAAAGGSAGAWAQHYLYDRYGNRTNALSQKTSEFVTNLYQGVLGRNPDSGGLEGWDGYLRQSYAQGQSQFMQAARDTAAGFFHSQEYIDRNRSDEDYIRDLYHGYLNRDPDPDGWAYYTTVLPVYGREAIRQGFANSPEFADRVSGMYPAASTYAPAVPRDGWEGLSFDAATNRVNSASWEYDAAGNLTRGLSPSGSWQRYEYDAAGRMVKVKDDAGNVLSINSYGATNERVMTEEGGARTYYVGGGLSEYVEYGGSTQPQWSKSYVYLGGRLLATLTPNGATEAVQYQHPDRLGTRLITNGGDANYSEQATLPYGTALASESTTSTNRRFTSYDRSNTTGLDYAVNRHYDSRQGRFTQVDPIGAGAASLAAPQTWNMYAYCGNDPINSTDADGLFFGKLFRALGKVFKWVAVAVAVAVAVVAVVTMGAVPALTTIKLLLSAASTLVSTFGSKKLGLILGLAAAGIGIFQGWGKGGIIWNFNSERGVSDAEVLAHWASAVGAVANFLSLLPQRHIRTRQKQQSKDSCPDEKRRFFDWLSEPLGRMAQELNTTKALMLTMAAKEGGWTKGDLDHNQPLNNPFGVNLIRKGKAVGNVKYPSLDDATQYWKGRFGSRVSGAQNADDFLRGLQHPAQGDPYNSVDSDYEGKFRAVNKSMSKYMQLCGVQ
jgi:RHS repeat-associated protein